MTVVHKKKRTRLKYPSFFLKRKNDLYSYLILVLSIGFTYYGCFASMGLVKFHMGSYTRGLKFDQFGSTYIQVLLLVLLFFVLKMRREKNYLNITFQMKDIRDSFILFLVGYPMLCFLGVLVYLVFSHFTQDFQAFQPTERLKSLVGFLSNMSVWGSVIFIAVNAIFEEGIIRVLFMNELNGFIRKGYVVVVLSALIQAGYHLYQGWLRCSLVFFFFLIFAIYYQKFKRTTPLVLAHFYVDFFSFALVKIFRVEL